ncbi:Beta-galactosidase-1-like protein 2 [Armadillidium vulgare]|nr:Beta-galactosidase-1-like protein 2 [Armadillidium vulgare]
MPWNLHNPEEGKFDFGTGDEILSPFLDVRTFVQMAQEEDLFVLLRPGPYICSEWDFGGLPSWLLTDYTMNVRTMYQGYIDKVQIFFQKVGEQLADLTFQKGGAIIAVQVWSIMQKKFGFILIK